MAENENSDRDTNFQQFARLLWEELLSQTEGLYIDVSAGHIPLLHPEEDEHQRYIAVIARRAYDLHFHTLKNTDPLWLDLYGMYTRPSDEDIHQSISHMPDMTEFPAEKTDRD